MYIFHFGHYSFDLWAHWLNYISLHASSGSLGQHILTVFGCHAHWSWPDQLNETGQHGKIVFWLECSNRISAKISWHISNGHLYTLGVTLLVWKVTESCHWGPVQVQEEVWFILEAINIPQITARWSKIISNNLKTFHFIWTDTW